MISLVLERFMLERGAATVLTLLFKKRDAPHNVILHRAFVARILVSIFTFLRKHKKMTCLPVDLNRTVVETLSKCCRNVCYKKTCTYHCFIYTLSKEENSPPTLNRHPRRPCLHLRYLRLHHPWSHHPPHCRHHPPHCRHRRCSDSHRWIFPLNRVFRQWPQ